MAPPSVHRKSYRRHGAQSTAKTEQFNGPFRARTLAGKRSCFIGVRRPSTAALLARMRHNPDLVLVYESGTIGAKPHRVPLSIGDGELAERADAVVSVTEMFNYWIGAGRSGVAFLGGAPELLARG
jgi:glutaconate CoA-transferase subunit B